MKYSQNFGKTQKISPKEAETVSHQLLIRAGLIDKALSSGIYSLLPLGWRVYKKIENIIREEMNRIKAQELFMPTLQPKKLWEETARWKNYEPPLFVIKDRHEKLLCLGPTHEEVVTDLVRRYTTSYKDFPLYLYHIQNKFRNEMRPTGGVLRTREFMMKDLYSFHTTAKDLDDYYLKVIEAYKKIFQRCGLTVKVIEASGGAIGGEVTHEFNMLCPTGEDKVLYCPKCDFAANIEVYQEKKCKQCGSVLQEGRGIENGHVFKLGTKYSQAMKLEFIDKFGKKQLVWMGCYGIGLQRLLATIVEVYHDDRGIIWPKSVSPFEAYFINIGANGQKIYQDLSKNASILWDDRENVSPGQKFSDADLLGIPARLVISPKTGDKIEWKERDKKELQLLTFEEVIKKLS